MGSASKYLSATKQYLQADYAAWPLRFIAELVAWAGSITCAITMALTLPSPPFIILYPAFMLQCAIFGWGAWTRGSFGMTANCVLLVIIDLTGYIRFLLH